MFLSHSPARRPQRGRSRRPLSLALITALGIAGLLILWPAQGLGDQGAQVCTQNSQNGILCLTVSDTPDPVSTSTADGNSYLSYHAVVSNQSASSNLSHVGLSETLPADAPYFSATTSRGNCSHAGQSVTCAIGALSAGQSASVDVVVITPPTSETITNVVRGSFDENFNDNPNNGGKQDTVAYPNVNTTVSSTAQQTFVPAGASGQVDTSPDPHQQGNGLINHPSTDVLASINLNDSNDSFDNLCPSNGQVKIGKKNYVCRQGASVDALVLCASPASAPASCAQHADGQEHYSDPNHPLVFHLQWDGTLTSTRQTKRNFVVFYQPDGGGSVQVITNRCNAGATNLPCLRNISPLANGGWEVDLVKADNGRMK